MIERERHVPRPTRADEIQASHSPVRPGAEDRAGPDENAALAAPTIPTPPTGGGGHPGRPPKELPR